MQFPLPEDGAQHPQPVCDCIEIASPMDPSMFEAWDLSNDEISHRHSDVDQRLDLETVSPKLSAVGRRGRSCRVETKSRNKPSPENIVTVAQIGIASAITTINEMTQERITECS